MSPARRLAEARLALMLLTRLPAGRLADPVPELAAARWAFPLVGLAVGALGWGAQAAAVAAGLGPAVAALAALAAMVLATGALHLDGLADFADGMGGGRDCDHCLQIMRDSRIGSYGTIALILALGLAAAALARFDAGAPLAVLLFVGVASRLAMLVVLDLLPPARADGLGQRVAVPAHGPPKAWAPGAIVLVVVAAAIGPAALAALAAAAVAAALVARIARRRIGGQTGDVLGAAQVVAEVACLLAFAASAA